MEATLAGCAVAQLSYRDEMTTLVTLRAAAASVSGLVRQGNEDAVYAGRRLLAVADGMGGHAAGEVASAAVIETLRACDIVTAPGELEVAAVVWARSLLVTENALAAVQGRAS